MEKINLKFVSLGAFIISLIYTCKLMLTNSSGITDQVLTLGTACVLEFSKCAFLYKALSPANLKQGAKVTMGVIGSFLFLVSICASLAFLFNQANETYNRDIMNSKAYQQKLEIINDIKNQRDILPVNYPTKKIQLTQQIERLTKELNAEFPLKSTTGYQAFFQVVTDMIAKEHKQEPLSASKLQLLFFAIISITFEVTAIFLFYLSEKEEKAEQLSEISNTAQPQPYVDFEQLLKMKKELENKEINSHMANEKEDTRQTADEQPIREEKIIGFKPKDASRVNPQHSKKFKEEELKAYLEFVINDCKERETNVLIGYKKIADKLGISENKALDIKKELKNQNFLKVEGNKTFLVS